MPTTSTTPTSSTKMTLAQVLTACENQLGWNPGMPLRKQRAVMGHIMTKAMKRKGVSIEDLALTVAWCRRRHLPIDSPLQLLPMVERVLEEAPVRVPARSLDSAVDSAITWEHELADDDSTYWIGRLVRSQGPARADTLTEWQAAGRGQPQ